MNITFTRGRGQEKINLEVIGFFSLIWVFGSGMSRGGVVCEVREQGGLQRLLVHPTD